MTAVRAHELSPKEWGRVPAVRRRLTVSVSAENPVRLSLAAGPLSAEGRFSPGH
jgi:hypothetical protein